VLVSCFSQQLICYLVCELVSSRTLSAQEDKPFVATILRWRCPLPACVCATPQRVLPTTERWRCPLLSTLASPAATSSATVWAGTWTRRGSPSGWKALTWTSEWYSVWPSCWCYVWCYIVRYLYSRPRGISGERAWLYTY